MAAGQSRRVAQPEAGIYGARYNVGRYFYRGVTTTSGTLDTATSDTAAASGLTVTKTATETGRYTFQTPTPHRRLLKVNVNIRGADDAAYGATTLGLGWILRDDDITSDGTFEIQFLSGSAYGDAEIADAASFDVEVIVEG